MMVLMAQATLHTVALVVAVLVRLEAMAEIVQEALAAQAEPTQLTAPHTQEAVVVDLNLDQQGLADQVAVGLELWLTVLIVVLVQQTLAVAQVDQAVELQAITMTVVLEL